MTCTAQPDKPYVGLRPYGEGDREFFFGREEDESLIYANAVAARLTVLYGPSGVGKSSLLRAGVIPHIRQHGSAAAVYFNRWQVSDFARALNEQCAAALREPGPAGTDAGDPAVPFDECLRQATRHAGRRIFVLLDQFEEYLLYSTPRQTPGSFDAALARAINRRDVDARVLIGIREDALHRFDQRFRGRIVNPLGNTLRLNHLTDAQARLAVEEPLRVFREKHPATSAPARVDDATIDALLRQVRPVRRAGEPGPDTGGRDVAIETAYLQLVLDKLWEAELRNRSPELRLTTLETELGGASRIVLQHLLAVLASLSPRQRTICEHILPHLVTPSLSKIAHETGDLIAFVQEKGRYGEAEITDVLTQLSAPSERRILRRTAPPERFEIFHDVLAKPITEWLEGRRRSAATSWWQRVAAGLVVAVLVVSGLAAAAIYLGLEARRAKEQAQALSRVAEQQRAAFEQARDEAVQLAKERDEAAALRREALEQLRAGNEQMAATLEAAAAAAERRTLPDRALTASELSEIQRLRRAVEQLEADVSRLTDENVKLRAAGDRSQGEIERLTRGIGDRDRQIAELTAQLKAKGSDGAPPAGAQQRPPSSRAPALFEPPGLRAPPGGVTPDMFSEGAAVFLRLLDQYGRPLNDTVTISIRHTRLNDRRQHAGIDGRTPILISSLNARSGGTYSLDVRATRYLPVKTQFTVAAYTEIEKNVTFEIDADQAARIRGATFPAFAELPEDLRQVLARSSDVDGGTGTGQALYDSLDALKRANLFNVYTRMRAMVQKPGLTAWSHVERVSAIRSDRVLLEVQSSLYDLSRRSVDTGHLVAVAQLLTGPDGYVPAGAYSSPERTARLRLAFFVSSAGTESMLADAAFDAGGGSGRSLHPYVVHQMLWKLEYRPFYQLDP